MNVDVYSVPPCAYLLAFPGENSGGVEEPFW